MSETHSATVNRRHYTDCGLEDWRANVLLADPEVEEATCAECFRVRCSRTKMRRRTAVIPQPSEDSAQGGEC